MHHPDHYVTLRYSVERACAGPGCLNPLPAPGRGRPARYCSPACRVRAYRRRRGQRGAISVEVDHGLTSSKGRPAGKTWLVRLRRGDEVVIVAIGLTNATAERLAERIRRLVD